MDSRLEVNDNATAAIKLPSFSSVTLTPLVFVEVLVVGLFAALFNACVVAGF